MIDTRYQNRVMGDSVGKGIVLPRSHQPMLYEYHNEPKRYLGPYDSVTDFGNINDLILQSFTIAFTVQIDQAHSGTKRFVRRCAGTAVGQPGFTFYYTGTTLALSIKDGTTRAYVAEIGDPLPNPGTYDVVGNCDRINQTMELWVDGSLVDNTVVEGPISSIGSCTNSEPFEINTNSSHIISNVRYYDGWVLTPSELF